ncbi:MULTISPECIES: NAD(P)-dependent oxidoreductase [unclassified Sphingomonas]|uniref:NAD(P)-dependent oxidoreductase n=1 Tax=unclassified Sphingomonas TaxID=196159 RepID=UPI00092AA34E|nr:MULTISPECIES: NAD(P)-dependent oxidoreductase [unclassified Sphingomonas]OJU15459.1 MAG: 6-phosphogluconate dehydrogenase [Sphingomonas sp. 66-10]
MRGATFIGFGEAGAAFAPPGRSDIRGYDIKLDTPATRANKLADFAAAGVARADSAAEALAGAQTVLSLVTADQALVAAHTAAPHLASDALWLDMNSVAPDTKRAAAAAIGARYVDVAVMAPVHPGRHATPLLVAGPHAEAGAAALRDLGFTNIAIAGPSVGDASAIKMIRSVMVKGIEALTAECALAAEAAGVRAAVIASLDASWPGADWAKRFDYNLDRMMLHGQRRAAEMEEVTKTLDALGTGSAMTRGTVERQRAIGSLNTAPPDGLAAKLDLILPLLTRQEQPA